MYKTVLTSKIHSLNCIIKNNYAKLKIWTVGSHDLSSIYFKQVGATTIIKFLSILISIIYVPLVLGYLNQEKYGIWVTLTTIVNWIRVLDVGMGNGMRNKLAEAIALKQYQQGRIYVSTTYGIIGSIFLLVLLVFYLVNPFLNWQSILNSVLISQSELVRLSNIVVTFIVLGFILQPIVLIYTAHGNSAAGAVVQLIMSSVTLLLIWLASLFADKGNIILLAWIVTGVPVLIYIGISVYVFIYKYPHFRPSFKLIKISESGNLLPLSLQFFVVQITATIIFSSIPFIIAQLFNPNEVTVFSIANSIFNLPIMLMSLIAMPILPLVTQAFANQDYTWIRSMLKKMNIFALLIVAGTIIMIIISPFIYKVWIGNKAAIPLNLSLAIGIYTIINILSTSFSIFINGIGKIRILVILGPLGIFIFIGFSILFSKILNNVIGVSIALSISSLIGLIAIPIELNKYLKKTAKY
jgi:O-antigen/teichoic acid export membrane protein